MGRQSQKLTWRMKYTGTLNEEQLNKKEKNKPNHTCFIILLGFFAVSLKREEFKLESKLCLWGSQSRTTNWNKQKSICRPLRPHVALCTHKHRYGISNASEKIHLCENIIQHKFWYVLELSTPWCHLSTLWTPSIKHPRSSAKCRREDTEISFSIRGFSIVLTSAFFNKSL